MVRIEPDEETQSLMVYLGAEFHPPAIPEAAPPPVPEELEEEIEEPQPVVPGQPTAGSPRIKKGTKKSRGGIDADGNVIAPAEACHAKSAAPRKRRTPLAG